MKETLPIKDVLVEPSVVSSLLGNVVSVADDKLLLEPGPPVIGDVPLCVISLVSGSFEEVPVVEIPVCVDALLGPSEDVADVSLSDDSPTLVGALPETLVIWVAVLDPMLPMLLGVPLADG